jgi:hypothetical protein
MTAVHHNAVTKHNIEEESKLNYNISDNGAP